MTTPDRLSTVLPIPGGAVTASADTVLVALQDTARTSVNVMSAYMGIADLTMAEDSLISSLPRWGRRELGSIISRRARVGWTTGGHTATDVNLYAFGPGADRLVGNMDNDQLGQALLEMIARRIPE